MLPIILSIMVVGQVLYYKKHNTPSFQPPDRIIIYKHKKLLLVSRSDHIVKKYPVCFGYQEGKKIQSGDGKTPEGRYAIVGKKHKSIFVHSLQLNYPNEEDKKRAQSGGYHPGDSITIHGTGNDPDLKKRMRLGNNWTRGCIGMHNHHIRELFKYVPIGIPVEIHP